VRPAVTLSERDAKRYTDEARRAWIFRTVGYGHDALVWRDVVSALRVAGYDHVISIEHEDSHGAQTWPGRARSPAARDRAEGQRLLQLRSEPPS
jgi:sugar phosphate isomerase/epimerase